MSVIENRLRENYPPILMTLVSLIVALIFENLVGELGSRPALWRATPENFFVLAQSAFLGVSAMAFWFTLSLHSAAVRVIFSPRDAFGAVASGLFFFVLAATIGSGDGVVWMYAGAALHTAAWITIADYGRLYIADPAASGGIRAHRTSSRMMLGSAIVVGVGGSLRYLLVLDASGVAATLLVSVAIMVVAHILWFREFKSAVGLGNLAVPAEGA